MAIKGWATYTVDQKLDFLLGAIDGLKSVVSELSASLDDRIGDLKYQDLRHLKSDLESQVADVERKFNNELDSVRRDVSNLDRCVDQAERDITNLERQARY